MIWWGGGRNTKEMIQQRQQCQQSHIMPVYQASSAGGLHRNEWARTQETTELEWVTPQEFETVT
jgi:hypothetical protein